MLLFQGTLESMMKCAEDQCPHVLADDRVQSEIRKMCREKNFLAPEFIHTCILEQAGADIMNKVKWVFYVIHNLRLETFPALII